jgi:phage-related protein (TIGR01555 family)
MSRKRKKNSYTDLLNPGFHMDGMGQNPINNQASLAYNTRWDIISFNPVLLTSLYMSNGIVRTYIEQIVDDALRGVIKITSNNLSAEEKQELLNWFYDNLIDKVRQATIWARLYGGGGIIIDTGRSPSSEFSMSEVSGKYLKFYSCDRWELTNPPRTDLQNKFRDNPINEADYLYYETPLSQTRVLKFIMDEVPARIRTSFNGWGASVLESAIAAINMYEKSSNIIYEILDEIKVSVLKLNGFNARLGSDVTSTKMQKYINTFNYLKNYKSLVAMDATDDFEQKTVSTSGLAELGAEARYAICSELRRPMAKLFGLSSSTTSASDFDIENYNLSVENEVRAKIKPLISKLLRIGSKHLFNKSVEKIEFEYPNLRLLSEDLAEKAFSLKVNQIVALVSTGVMSRENASQIINDTSLFSLPIDLDFAITQDDFAREGLLEETLGDGHNSKEKRADSDPNRTVTQQGGIGKKGVKASVEGSITPEVNTLSRHI